MLTIYGIFSQLFNLQIHIFPVKGTAFCYNPRWPFKLVHFCFTFEEEITISILFDVHFNKSLFAPIYLLKRTAECFADLLIFCRIFHFPSKSMYSAQRYCHHTWLIDDYHVSIANYENPLVCFFLYFFLSLYPTNLLLLIVPSFFPHEICLWLDGLVLMLKFAYDMQFQMIPLAALDIWTLTVWFWMMLFGWMTLMGYLLPLIISRVVKLLVSIVSGSLITKKAVSQIR